MALKLARNHLGALLGLLFSYILALFLLTYQGSILYTQTKESINEWKKTGFTREVRDSIDEISGSSKEFRNNANSLLLIPFGSIIKSNREFIELIQVYDYLQKSITGLSQILLSDSRKQFLVVFQNPAEARGTGGIIGAFAVVSIEKGEIAVERVGSNAILQSQDNLPTQMPKEFVQLYRSDPAIWQNSNLSPHFPYGAKIWLKLWEQQFNERLDGVITLDPIVLSSILEEIGPVNVEGNVIDSGNVVQESLSTTYLRYEKDNEARKAYLVKIIESVASKALSPNTNKLRLAWSMAEPVIQNRILIYSDDPKIQSNLAKSRISGALSTKPSNEIRLVLQNTAGNKMDYYIKRSLKLTSLSCKNPKLTEAVVTLTNSVNPDKYLPNYVKGRLDLGRIDGKDNSTALSLFLYSPPNGRITSAMDIKSGNSVGYIKSERLREVLVIPLELEAKKSTTFVVDIEGGTGKISTHEQPLVIPQKTVIRDKCKI